MTPAHTPPEPTTTVFTPIKCKRCGTTIAYCHPEGTQIKVSDNALIHERVEIQCAVCGLFRRWKPQKIS